jgi:hypothetical protein
VKLEKKANKIVASKRSEEKDEEAQNPADGTTAPKIDGTEPPTQPKPRQKKAKGAAGSSKKGGGFGDGTGV